MGKMIKINLKYRGEKIQTLDDLQQNFDPEGVVRDFKSGVLGKWLKSRRLQQQLEQIQSITAEKDDELRSALAEIFGVVLEDTTEEDASVQEPPEELPETEGFEQAISVMEKPPLPEKKKIRFINSFTVASDKELVYQNAVVYMETDITCAGVLKFEDCKIIYNQTDSFGRGRIKMMDRGALHFDRCEFICGTVPDEVNKAFISSEYDAKSEVEFIGCTIHDAGEFLSLSSPELVYIDSCNFYNSRSVLRVSCENYSKVEIRNCRILQEKIISWSGYGIFDICGSENQYVLVDNCFVQGTPAYLGANERLPVVFSLPKRASIENCTFENMRRCIVTKGNISCCNFSKCIGNPYYGVICLDSRGKIKNCIFVNCSSLEDSSLFSIKKAEIVDCKFIGCKGEIARSDYNGGLYFLDCEFSAIECEKLLDFRRSDVNDKVSEINSIEHCSFKNIISEKNMITVESNRNIGSKYVLKIVGSEFINCKTGDSDKPVKTWDYFLGASYLCHLRVTHIINCPTLNKPQGEPDLTVPEVALVTKTGRRIGCEPSLKTNF